MKNRVVEFKWIKYKKCTNCEVKREVTEFVSNGYSAKGTKLYKPKCKACFNLIVRNDRIMKEPSSYKANNRSKKYYKQNKDIILERLKNKNAKTKIQS